MLAERKRGGGRGVGDAWSRCFKAAHSAWGRGTGGDGPKRRRRQEPAAPLFLPARGRRRKSKGGFAISKNSRGLTEK